MKIKSHDNTVTITTDKESLEIFPFLGSVYWTYVGENNTIEVPKDTDLYKILNIYFDNKEKIYSAEDMNYIEIKKNRKNIKIRFSKNKNGYSKIEFKNNKIVDVYNRLLEHGEIEVLAAYLEAINTFEFNYQNRINKYSI